MNNMRSFILSVALAWTLNSCMECDVKNIRIISGLKGNRSIIAYSSLCGRNVESESLSFKREGQNLGKESGDIFFQAPSYWGIYVELISSDSVKVVHLGGKDPNIRLKRTEVDGIHFIYINSEKEYNKMAAKYGKIRKW